MIEKKKSASQGWTYARKKTWRGMPWHYNEEELAKLETLCAKKGRILKDEMFPDDPEHNWLRVRKFVSFTQEDNCSETMEASGTRSVDHNQMESITGADGFTSNGQTPQIMGLDVKAMSGFAEEELEVNMAKRPKL